LCNCTHRDNATLPNITLYIDQAYYLDISPWTLLYDYENPSTAEHYEELCRFALVNNTHSNVTWKLGIPFLRNYYTIFDADNAKIGITPSVHSNATLYKGKGVYAPIKSNIIAVSTTTSSSVLNGWFD
jgi:Eukaryotic aspartyl protease